MKKMYLIVSVLLTSLFCFSSNSISEEFNGSHDNPHYATPPVEEYDDNWSIEKYKDVLVPRTMKPWKPGDKDETDLSKFFHELAEAGIQFVMSPGPRVIIKIAPINSQDQITAEGVCKLASKYNDFSIKSMLIVKASGDAQVTNCEMLEE